MIGLGAGGHSTVLIEALAAIGGYEVVGLLDPRQELHGTTVLGIPVLGDDGLIGEHYDSGVRHAFIGLGGASDTAPRRRLYELARSSGLDVVTVVHPAASVSPSAELGHGATVFAGAVVGTEARLGENVLVNTAAVVEHGCTVGDHAHVATGARLASGVRVGEGAHIGAGSTVVQERSVGPSAVVGAGAVVVRDVEAGMVVVGVPARVLRPVGDGS